MVEKWVKRHLSCWQTGINTGPRVGRIDVVGVRDVGGDLSGRSEVIAVEVKAGTQVFTTAAGQAHGYSVLADRCYLADYRPGRDAFSADEMLIAGRLGIGLAAIRANNRVDEILTAPPGVPIEELRLQVLGKVGLAECRLCGTLFRYSEGGTGRGRQLVTRAEGVGDLAKAAQSERGYMWWLNQAAEERDQRGRQYNYWRRYLCPDCARALTPAGQR